MSTFRGRCSLDLVSLAVLFCLPRIRLVSKHQVGPNFSAANTILLNKRISHPALFLFVNLVRLFLFNIRLTLGKNILDVGAGNLQVGNGNASVRDLEVNFIKCAANLRMEILVVSDLQVNGKILALR